MMTMMEITLAGKTALVTGVNIGIGRAVSMAFARCGADVALTCHSHRQEGEETARALSGWGARL
jgi:3-oxoacyl-[acyl-carrier protein] reductase